MLALQALCVFEAVGDAFADQLNDFLQDEEALTDLGIDLPPSPELVKFARTLTLGTWGQRDALNEILATAAAHWSLTRMTPVDRNVLRLGLHELLEHPETPPRIVINEAIELARRFGDTDSPAFVNGVLDSVRRASEDNPTPTSDEGDSANAKDTEDADGAV